MISFLSGDLNFSGTLCCFQQSVAVVVSASEFAALASARHPVAVRFWKHTSVACSIMLIAGEGTNASNSRHTSR